MPILNKCLLIIVASLTLFSCKQNPEEYLSETSTSKDYVKTLRDDFRYITCAYRPAEYMALREVMYDSTKTASPKDYAEAFNTFKDGVYFEVRIGLKNKDNILKAGIPNEETFRQRLYYLHHGMGRDFFIIKDNNEKVYPLYYQFMNPDGLSNTSDFLFVFSKSQLNNTKNIDVYYTDRVFNMTRDIHFSYPAALIHKVSKLKLQQ